MFKPLHFMFEVTSQCNNNCLYCYNVWKNNPQYPLGEIGLPQIKQLFKPLLDNWLLKSITLTGGEPLLRKDIVDIVSFFKENFVYVSLATNGLLLDKNLAKELSAAKLDSIEIPLLSMNKFLHNELSLNDAFDSALSAVANATENKIPTAIVFVATRKNIQDALDVFNFAQHCGVSGFLFDRFVAQGEGIKYKEELLPDSKEIQNAITQILRAKENSKSNIYFSVSIPLEFCEAKISHEINCTTCSAGKDKFVIDFLGNLRLCEQHPLILGNLFRDDFYALVNKEEVNYFKDFIPEKCKNCQELSFCGCGCKIEALV